MHLKELDNIVIFIITNITPAYNAAAVHILIDYAV